MAENAQNLMKTKLHIQKAQQTPSKNKKKAKRCIPINIIIKHAKDKEKILKATREKRSKGSSMR